MDRWEYQVIHINVEPPKPAAAADEPGGQASGAPEAGGVKPVFSETFLKKEFPQFYEKPSEANGGQPQHPAQQLQSFLNGHGNNGWELVGVFPVGSLTMMFFRRPKPAGPAPVATPVATPEATATKDSEAAAPGSLQEVLRRLDAIEGRLGDRPNNSAPPKPASPMTASPLTASPMTASSLKATPLADSGRNGGSMRTRSEPGSVSPREGRKPKARRSETLAAASGEWVSAAQLANLADESKLPSSQAALAIGLRSATSLANHGARYGYTPGLSKVGPNGMVAIYTGAGAAESGGKERRLWIVVSAGRLLG